MLIKFDSDVGGFSIDGEIAIQLLKIMGHSGTVPGAMLAADIPAALSRLRSTVERSPRQESDPDAEDEGRESPVSLRQRAYPLIDLLSRAAEQRKDILWK
jgi:hypothetical protein